MAIRHLTNLLSDRLTSLPILVLYITDGCNSRCVTCDIWRSPRRNMRMELIETLAAEAKTLGVRWVVFSGGEAMQHPEWAVAAHHFQSAGIRVILLTNGLLVRRQLQTVINHVDELVVSLDGGTPETYNAIRGVDGFDLILDGIRSTRAGGIPVITRTTLQRANFREMPQIIQAAKRANVNHISFLTVDVSNPFAFGPRFLGDDILPLIHDPSLHQHHPQSESFPASIGAGADPEHGPPATALTLEECDEFAEVINAVERDYAADFTSKLISESPAKLRRMVNYFRAVLGVGSISPVRCNAPHTSVVIEVDGRIRPCYFLPTVGRVRVSENISLTSALNTDAARDMRRAYRTGERQECALCVCPLHKGARSLLTL